MSLNKSSSTECLPEKESEAAAVKEVSQPSANGTSKPPAANTIQSLKPKTSTKICRVCGDRALSYNFGVISCESCKAFFRRNGTRTEHFSCPFSAKCPTNIRSRKHCQSCRLRKCFAVGMKVEGVIKRRHNNSFAEVGNFEQATPAEGDTSGGNDNQSHSESAGRACQNVTVVTDDCDICVSIRFPSSKCGDNQGNSTGKVDQLVSAVKAAVKESLSPTEKTDRQMDTESSTTQSIGAEADLAAAKQTAMTTKTQLYQQTDENRCKRLKTDDDVPEKQCTELTRPPTSQEQLFPFCSTPFSAEIYKDSSATLDVSTFDAPLLHPAAFPLSTKHLMLEELLIANNSWNKQLDPVPPLHGSRPDQLTNMDLHNLTVHIYSRIIYQHRNLSAFKKLPRADQLELLKARVSDLVFTRLSIVHNRRTSQTYVGYPGHSELPSDITKRFGADFYNESLKLKTTYPEQFRNETILVLLTAIALFNPDHPMIKNKTAIFEERKIYLQILKEYLDGAFGASQGQWANRFLCTWLSCIPMSSHLYRPKMLCDIDPVTLDISQLVLYDLKEATEG